MGNVEMVNGDTNLVPGNLTPLFAVVLGTMVRRDAVIGQLIQDTKFKAL